MMVWKIEKVTYTAYVDAMPFMHKDQLLRSTLFFTLFSNLLQLKGKGQSRPKPNKQACNMGAIALGRLQIHIN